jgi:hypothetical protein
MGLTIKSEEKGGRHEEDLLKARDGVGQEGEGEHDDVNLKTRKKRQHSGTFIIKEIQTKTNNVQRLVEKYEGWEKESGVSGTTLNSRGLFRFGQTPGEDETGSPMKRRKLAGDGDTEPPPGSKARHLPSSGPRPSPRRCPGTRWRQSSTPASCRRPPTTLPSPFPSKTPKERETRRTVCRWPPSSSTWGSTSSPTTCPGTGRQKEHEIAPARRPSLMDTRLAKPGRAHPPSTNYVLNLDHPPDETAKPGSPGGSRDLPEGSAAPPPSSSLSGTPGKKIKFKKSEIN